MPAIIAGLTDEEATALEEMVDRCGLSTVVSALAVICGEKALHVQANWNDRALTKAWTFCAGHLHRAEASINRENLP